MQAKPEYLTRLIFARSSLRPLAHCRRARFFGVWVPPLPWTGAKWPPPGARRPQRSAPVYMVFFDISPKVLYLGLSMKCTNPRSIQLREAIPSIIAPGQYITRINTVCGKCLYCIERKKTEWCFRMEIESRYAVTKYFVTLTYHTDHLVFNRYGKKILVRKHLTDYMKRLRYYHSKGEDNLDAYVHGLSKHDKLKMFACGEYGSEKGRPHFHLMIFNASRKDIERAWTFGNVHCIKAQGNGASAYIMKYMDKHLGKKQDCHKPKEFTTQSEGIGIQYVEKMGAWHKRNLDVCYVSSPSGAMLPMPRYLRLKIFTEEERMKQTGYIHEVVTALELDEVKQVGREGIAARKHSEERIRKLKFERALKARMDT